MSYLWLWRWSPSRINQWQINIFLVFLRKYDLTFHANWIPSDAFWSKWPIFPYLCNKELIMILMKWIFPYSYDGQCMKRVLMQFAENVDPDQHARWCMHRLIWTFSVCWHILQLSTDSVSRQRRPRSACADQGLPYLQNYIRALFVRNVTYI